MLEFFKFILSDFWISLGVAIIISATLNGIQGIVKVWRPKCKCYHKSK